MYDNPTLMCLRHAPPPPCASALGVRLGGNSAFRGAPSEYIRQGLSLACKGKAMTLAGRRRPIRNDMPEMTSAPCTDFFYTGHSITSVAHSPNVGFVIRLEEARPPGTGIELRARPK